MKFKELVFCILLVSHLSSSITSGWEPLFPPEMSQQSGHDRDASTPAYSKGEILETGYLFLCSASICVILDALCLEEATAQLKVQRLP